MVQKTQLSAFISEIFSSAQGEGIHIGRRQLFVRFCDCHRNCLYCDTDFERKETSAIERDPGSGVFDAIPNPLSIEQLLEVLSELNGPDVIHDDLFITGGEPLLQADFLEHFLPKAHKQLDLPIHLETSGDLTRAFSQIHESVDHVLMDIKLPSVTGEAETWELHQAFLREIKAKEIGTTIKLVVGADTSDADLAEAVELITATDICAHVVLQPMTAALKTARVPTAGQVLGWQSQMAIALGHSVRVIPQCHKLMGLL